MAKIKNPVRFSDHFKLDPAQLDRAGVLNPALNVDTELFMNPLLMESLMAEHSSALPGSEIDEVAVPVVSGPLIYYGARGGT